MTCNAQGSRQPYNPNNSRRTLESQSSSVKHTLPKAREGGREGAGRRYNHATTELTKRNPSGILTP